MISIQMVEESSSWDTMSVLLVIGGGLVILAVVLVVIKLVNKKGKRPPGMVHNKPKKNDYPSASKKKD